MYFPPFSNVAWGILFSTTPSRLRRATPPKEGNYSFPLFEVARGYPAGITFHGFPTVATLLEPLRGSFLAVFRCASEECRAVTPFFLQGARGFLFSTSP
ncbi:MAG: hypothetical protein A2X64_11380 [Ignavibacteria bacterium GWF2_33_9]|nr:MAG: hypothetical protein A2X64_11380 [Ignavibacteria bacterium GWF2_33_9]